MSLRNVVIALLGCGVVVALALAATHHTVPWIALAVYWSIGIVLILVERGRYRPRASGGTLTATQERFFDPVTGKRVDVYVDETTGRREYRSPS
ncbi:MAG: hypothetical protein IAI48_02235 [Candidatus Eremiobacteraeota bacterium]|nr:hypothetical protein [Candidatus Eremiobacteraeota bacterium]